MSCGIIHLGLGYVKALAQNYCGIPDVRLVQAVGLDLDGADPEQILQESIDPLTYAIIGR